MGREERVAVRMGVGGGGKEGESGGEDGVGEGRREWR